ncbi:MAG: protein kinase [Verrucomicrobiota bacterium]
MREAGTDRNADDGLNLSQDQLKTGLLTLVFTDIVGSTSLKQQLGDRAGARIIEEHHRIVREILGRFPGGQEIETAGDSFLIIFTTPSEAVTFALLLQNRLIRSRDTLQGLSDRIGIHLGEVVIREYTAGAKPRDLYGSNVDICSRVMSLAKADQVLMSRGVFDSARQVLKGEDIEGLASLEWLNHGPYLVKGVEEPIEICEVREIGREAPSPPTSSDKASRQVRAGEEQVLGWRPAVGQLVPKSQWVLEEKLGEGGFGEVWLGRHQTMKERRVFKFCFRADRVRSLKRELTLFRVLKERVGDHPHIVRLLGVSFEEPPFYVEMDYVHGQDLKNWCAAAGGIGQVPLPARLEIVAQVADGLQAAHDAGVIHRDIKPGNILIHQIARREEVRTSTAPLNMRDGTARPPAMPDPSQPGSGLVAKLTDFGIGQVVSQELLAGMTQAGFTKTLLGSESSSQTGTQLYMAPELLAGDPASIRSDIYSLGVVLFQLLVADFRCPVTTDWWKRVEDPLLREDLEQCFAGEPTARFPGAGLLAQRLRSLEQRRTAREREEAERQAREQLAYRRGWIRAASMACVVVLLVSGLAFLAWDQSRHARANADLAKHQQVRAESGERDARALLYVANINLAQTSEQNNIGRVRELLEQTHDYPDRKFEWYYWQQQAHLDLFTFRGHAAAVRSVAFSPDGRRLVTVSDDQTVKVWEADTGRELPPLRGHTNQVTSAVFSPDGNHIATASWDETARIWDASTGQEVRRLVGHGSRLSAVAFSPDGKRVATASWNSTAKLWDADTGKELLTLAGHNGSVSAVAFSADSERVATGSEDRSAIIWDVATGKALHSLKGPKGHTTIIWSLAFSRDGNRIVTAGGDQVVKVWDANTGAHQFTFSSHYAPVLGVAFSPDGMRVLSGGEDQMALIWDPNNGRVIQTLKGHTGSILALAFSRDGRQVATASDDGTVKLWDPAQQRGQKRLIGHSSSIVAAEFTRDGRQLVTGSWDRTANLWDPVTGQILTTFRGHSNAINAVAISPDGKRLLTGSSDRTAKLWDTASGAEMVTLPGHRGVVTSVAWSPKGDRVVTGSEDYSAQVWDAGTGRKLHRLIGHKGPVRAVAWSSDGAWIATGSDDRLAKIWNASTGIEQATARGHSERVASVAFAADGQRLVTGSEDRTARTWKTTNGQELVKFVGHTARLVCVAISRDGERLVTGAWDKSAKLWETRTGRELLTFKTPGNPVLSAAFSPDGRQIFAGLWDPIGLIWESASPAEVAQWRRDDQTTIDRLASFEAAGKAAQEKTRRALASDAGAIRHWLVLGPVPLKPEQDGAHAVAMAQIPGEADLRPRPGEPWLPGQADLLWQPVQQDDPIIDFEGIVGKASRHVAYAVTYIYASTPANDVQLKIGSDDEAKVYLNGKEVYLWSNPRSFKADQDTVQGLQLRAGVNVLVFKVVNETLDWKGSIHLLTREGKPLSGIKIQLTPD